MEIASVHRTEQGGHRTLLHERKQSPFLEKVLHTLDFVLCERLFGCPDLSDREEYTGTRVELTGLQDRIPVLVVL
jgi:hypothetical protein